MLRLKDLFEKVVHNQKLIHIVAPILLATVFVVVAFLTVNLFLYLSAKNHKSDEIPLYYDFKPNTVEYAYDPSIIHADISEQFLSYEVSYGVDVSEWQGGIDWERVKATGISFAMIRCGFRQTEGSEVIEDANFRKNIEGAIAAGLKVGVYFFGTAKTQEEALEEAEFTVNLIKDYNLTYPVVYDIETFNKGRLKNVKASVITDNILTFTETVGSYGYETMVYSYHDALSYTLDTGKLDGKLIWLAHWVDKTDYKGNYNMWQYTDSGRVDGIKTNVDLNVSYFTYVDTENEIVDNPNYVESPSVPLSQVNEQVKVKKKTTFRTSPTSTMPNRLGTISKGEVITRIGIGEVYSQIIYNDRSGYVLTKDLTVLE